MGRWWAGDHRERFWLEATDREDLGRDLRAPLTDAAGRDNWRYTLFREAAPGDVVFHYDGRVGAITSSSVVAGGEQSSSIVWAARGSYARSRNAEPVELPGYRIPLIDHQPLKAPIQLSQLRQRSDEMRAIVTALISKGGPLYFPFELSDRPLRPMQGYAFKFPADVVQIFPDLVEAVAARSAQPSLGRGAMLRAIVADIEAASGEFRIGQLQKLRLGLRRQSRTRVKTIFSAESTKDTYAFHSGGRDELQFNVGYDVDPEGRDVLRSGVAFSLETNQTLRSIDVLAPKVARFNDFIREQPEALSGLAMWHYEPGARRGDDGRRSANYAPCPIPADLFRPRVFIFLGRTQPLEDVDPRQCLRDFDQLLPLYTHVESAPARPVRAVGSMGSGGELGRGRDTKPNRWVHASYIARELDIYLRHNELQERLKARLLARGHLDVTLEAPIGLRAVDVVSRAGEDLCFYEVKTANTARGCLREAIGQLLEYALWPGATRPDRLVVVGEPELDADAEAYLATLNARFPIALSYESVALD